VWERFGGNDGSRVMKEELGGLPGTATRESAEFPSIWEHKSRRKWRHDHEVEGEMDESTGLILETTHQKRNTKLQHEPAEAHQPILRLFRLWQWASKMRSGFPRPLGRMAAKKRYLRNQERYERL
jgi:hypothetical protein